MSTETKTETNQTPATSDNKTVFAPLGKYAAVAVIMVTIIVTTAIMLDKQLQTVDEKIAVIEEEVTNMYPAESTIAEEVNTSSTTAATETEAQDLAATEETSTEAVAAVEVVKETQTATTDAATTNKPVVEETAVATFVSAEPAQSVAVEKPEVSTTKNTVLGKNVVEPRQQQLATENQLRIVSYKQQQKKHMSEMFARIKALESQQLGRYKANQDDQVVRLRKQIGQQQQMIETLVLRNKELFDLRAASVQRNQNNREQTLNRI